MNVGGKHYRTIWLHPENQEIVQIIDQTKLPFQFEVVDLDSVKAVESAISDMLVRGAGLIGATAGFGMYLAAVNASEKDYVDECRAAATLLKKSRPTAVNLQWAVDRLLHIILLSTSKDECVKTTKEEALRIADEDADMCRQIGNNGLQLIKEISADKGEEPVNILTHCNAGWLAFVDHGSATAPIYASHDAGVKVHVWVDETRPRNQGARLTAWELQQHGVPHTVIPDNAGGHLMQHGMVDLVITGADRVTSRGDAANKIGTYLKALAAKANDIPFYVALPSSTFDWSMKDGVKEIPIEQRDGHEVRFMAGLLDEKEEEVMIVPSGSPVANYGFDVTPAELITGLITERGICEAESSAIKRLYYDKF